MLNQIKTWLVGLCGAIIAQGCDIASSMIEVPGYKESNPFMRHPDGTFWLLHGLATKGLALGVYAGMSLLLYWMFQGINKKVAMVIALAPFAWLTYQAMDTAWGNILIYFLPHIDLN